MNYLSIRLNYRMLNTRNIDKIKSHNNSPPSSPPSSPRRPIMFTPPRNPTQPTHPSVSTSPTRPSSDGFSSNDSSTSISSPMVMISIKRLNQLELLEKSYH